MNVKTIIGILTAVAKDTPNLPLEWRDDAFRDCSGTLVGYRGNKLDTVTKFFAVAKERPRKRTGQRTMV